MTSQLFLSFYPRKYLKPTSYATPPPVAAEEAGLAAPPLPQPKITREYTTQAPTGCIPCSVGHLGTCSGLLNEAMRFARKDGLSSPEVADRVNMCLDELNSMERVDLRPEKVVALPAGDKALADRALLTSRELRHDLENLSGVDHLEKVAAKTQTTRNEIGREWMTRKFAGKAGGESHE